VRRRLSAKNTQPDFVASWDMPSVGCCNCAKSLAFAHPRSFVSGWVRIIANPMEFGCAFSRRAPENGPSLTPKPSMRRSVLAGSMVRSGLTTTPRGCRGLLEDVPKAAGRNATLNMRKG